MCHLVDTHLKRRMYREYGPRPIVASIPMIQAYPRRASVISGDTLVLHVSTDAPRFRIDFYRQGKTLQFMRRTDWLDGRKAEPRPANVDWEWPAYSFSLPDDWTSGAYIAILAEGDKSDHPTKPPESHFADGPTARALFVVRGENASILYKVPLATYHAYNYSGGASLYSGREKIWFAGGSVPGYKVTLRRPGGGTGGPISPHDTPDFYDQESRRQTFAHWDAEFISWFESNGHTADYCTDLDVHEFGDLLDHYDLLLSAGHDEYWSEEMRGNVERFIANGGNVAFFSANTCWYRIHFVDDDTAITCDKLNRSPIHPGTLVDVWWTSRPENLMTGVSYRNGGGRWEGPREAVGYTVQYPDHWVYDGTGIRGGEKFGDERAFPLVGYECDGAEFTVGNDLAPAVPTGKDGTPTDFLILGVGRLTPGRPRGAPPWQDLLGNHAATMGIYTSKGGGIVFNAATTDWAKLLGRNVVVSKITQNVVVNLRLPTIHIIGTSPTFQERFAPRAGYEAVFSIDSHQIESKGYRDLSFNWRISEGGRILSSQPAVGSTVEALMPQRPGQAFMSVTATVGTERPLAFGTLSFAVRL